MTANQGPGVPGERWIHTGVEQPMADLVLRFTLDEVREINRAAETKGMRLLEYIKWAALAAAPDQEGR